MQVESKFSLSAQTLEALVRGALGIPADATMRMGGVVLDLTGPDPEEVLGGPFDALTIAVDTSASTAVKIEKKLRKLQP